MLTPAEKRRLKRQRKAERKYILVIVLLMILIELNLITIKLMYENTLVQEDILNQVVNINQEVETRCTGQVEAHSTTLTDEQRQALYRIVMSESGDEDLLAQMAVAQTIYDRMNDFGDSFETAIETYSQHDNGEPTDSVKLAVANVFYGGLRVYEGGTYQFHDDTVNPYWTENKIKRGSIGRLTFYGGYENEI